MDEAGLVTPRLDDAIGNPATLAERDNCMEGAGQALARRGGSVETSSSQALVGVGLDAGADDNKSVSSRYSAFS